MGVGCVGDEMVKGRVVDVVTAEYSEYGSNMVHVDFVNGLDLVGEGEMHLYAIEI